jgi:hypothetical protein
VSASVFMGRATKKYSDLLRFSQMYSEGRTVCYLSYRFSSSIFSNRRAASNTAYLLCVKRGAWWAVISNW